MLRFFRRPGPRVRRPQSPPVRPRAVPRPRPPGLEGSGRGARATPSPRPSERGAATRVGAAGSAPPRPAPRPRPCCGACGDPGRPAGHGPAVAARGRPSAPGPAERPSRARAGLGLGSRGRLVLRGLRDVRPALRDEPGARGRRVSGTGSGAAPRGPVASAAAGTEAACGAARVDGGSGSSGRREGGAGSGTRPELRDGKTLGVRVPAAAAAPAGLCEAARPALANPVTARRCGARGLPTARVRQSGRSGTSRGRCRAVRRVCPVGRSASALGESDGEAGAVASQDTALAGRADSRLGVK